MARLWMELAATVLLSSFATLALVMWLRRGSRPFATRGTDDVEAVYVTVIATLYAILMAFMIFVVWTRYYDALNTVEREADALGDIYRLSAALPEPLRTQARQSCLEYARYMVNVEWPAMQRGEDIRRQSVLFEQMWTDFTRPGSGTKIDSVLRDHLMTSFIQLSGLRRIRLLEARTGLPDILYVVLIAGAVVTVGLAAVFATDDARQHALKACSLAALISLTLFTIYALDWPYDGLAGISSGPFQRTVEIMQAEGVTAPATAP